MTFLVTHVTEKVTGFYLEPSGSTANVGRTMTAVAITGRISPAAGFLLGGFGSGGGSAQARAASARASRAYNRGVSLGFI